VGSAAVAGLAGPGQVERVAGSWWFVALSLAIGLLCLTAAVLALARRRPLVAGAATHLGIVIGLVGVFLNQRLANSGYVLLEAGAGGKNFLLDRGLRRIEPLPFTVRLDGLSQRESRGFRPAPVATVSVGGRTFEVSYSRPLTRSGYRLLLARTVGPGFPHEYELDIDCQPYLLLHNQQADLPDGTVLSSTGYDREQGRLGIAAGTSTVWLAPGETATVAGTRLRLVAVDLARNAGAVFTAHDYRLRFFVFAGFGLALLGSAMMLFRRRR
jgi:hypothetical protein